ncbi:MAG: translation initiation factor IF-2 [Clostridia bacterium]|nr:translation initiation factor IF-2 [Clostridia bacterium]
MSKVKVYEMAKRVGMSNKDFLMKLEEWGIKLKSHLNVIEEADMKIIEEKLKLTKKGGEEKPATKKSAETAKKKDEPRIIRREIVQIKEEESGEKGKADSMDYELKPRKAANPEQFRRSDAQIEKKKTPIPSIMDLFKPKKAEPAVPEKKPEEPKPVAEELKPAEIVPPKAEIKEEVKEEVKTTAPVAEKKPEEKVQENHKPQENHAQRPSRPQGEWQNRNNNNRPQQQGGNTNRPRGEWQNRNNNNNRPQQQGNSQNRRPFNNNRPQFNKAQGVENQLKQALKDTPTEQVTKDVTRQFKPKPQNNDMQEKKTSKAPKNNNSHAENFSREHLKELRAGHKVSDLLNEDDSVLMNFYDFERRGKGGNKKKKEEQRPFEQPKQLPFSITVGESITVKELAEKLKKTSADLIKKLLSYGVMVTVNNEIDYDTAATMAEEYGVKIEKEVVVKAEDILFDESPDIEENLVTRPPIVVVMGHVDHGKTSLLDAIRESHVIDTEAGGITQHIGASTVNINGRDITFLDTPGHEAFTAMRARGAQVTDIAILVVAADDGIMPQTVEAINHAKAAGVSLIVAINKIDKEAANPDKVKQELMNYGVVPEEWGGDAICVPVSAKKRIGIDSLLETVTLVADVLDLKADPNRQAKGTVIEAKLDKGRGPVATLLVQRGTINVGDTVVAGNVVGHIRAMTDSRGRKIKKAGPSIPAEVVGLQEVPESGDIFYVVKDEKLAKQLVEKRKMKKREDMLKASSRVTLDDLFDKISAGEVKDLNIIVKADVQGSVEAVKQSLEKISNDEVRVRVIHGAVGAITESDVMLSQVSNAIIIGFNVRPEATAKAVAEREGVDIRLYSIIYNAIEDVTAAMKGMLAPKFKEEITGHAEIRHIFKIPGVGSIAGSYVTDGKIARNSSIRLIRDGIVVLDGKISSLKREKDDAKEVNEGYECGIGLEKFNDIKLGDIIEAYVMEEIARD